MRKHPKVTPGAAHSASDQSILKPPSVSGDHVVEQSHAAWDQLNLCEIDARLEVLSQGLLQNRQDCFQQKVAVARNSLPTEVFQLNHWKILGDARRAADLDYLRRFFRGLCEVFEDYFTRGGTQLDSQDLRRIWCDGIEPRWTRSVQILKAGLKRVYHNKSSQFVAALVVAFEDDAAHIHGRELALWRVKIEEAVTRNRYAQEKVVPDASRGTETGGGGKKVGSQGEASNGIQPLNKDQIIAKLDAEGNQKMGTSGDRALDIQACILDKCTPERMKRLTIIRQSLVQNPRMSAEEICKRLDVDNHPPLEEWRENYEVTTWSEAYKEPKLRSSIQSMLSKDKLKIKRLTDLPSKG